MRVVIIQFFQHLFQERDEVGSSHGRLELRLVKYLDSRPVRGLLVEIGVRRSDLFPQNIEVFFIRSLCGMRGELKPRAGQAFSSKGERPDGKDAIDVSFDNEATQCDS